MALAHKGAAKQPRGRGASAPLPRHATGTAVTRGTAVTPVTPATTSSTGVTTRAVVVGGRRPSRLAQREAAQVHVVGPDTLRHEARDLSDALDAVPGLRVVRIGGHGGAVQIQIRGATPAQSLVSLGDIPLRSPTGRSVDVEAIPVVALRGLELWRSRAPGGLGSTPIGGVIRLQPRTGGPDAEVQAGVGSFGATLLEARGAWGARRRSNGSVNLRVLTGSGDFPYRHNGGTPLDSRDDHTRKRGNNRVRRVSGLAQQRLRLGKRWRVGATWLGGWREQGLPGLAVAEASRSSLTVHHHDLVLRAASRRDGDAKEVWLRGGFEQLSVDDRLGELGPVQQRAQQVRAGEVGVRWRRGRGNVRPRAAVSARYGGVQTNDGFTGRDSPASSQAAASLNAGVDLRRGPVQLSPTLRALVIGSRRFEDQGWVGRWTAIDAPTRTLLSGEVGAALRFCAGCEARASLALANRAPTVVELFGNDGTVRPAPRLRDERARTISLATSLRRGDAARRGELSLSGFWSDRTDLIQLVRAGPGQAIHTNVGRAGVWGAEVTARGGWGAHLIVDAGWAWLRGRDQGGDPAYSGKALPMRPAGRWHVGTSWRHVRITSKLRGGVRLAARWQAGTFADRANLVVIPARSQFDAVVFVSAEGWRASARIDNAFDTARFDKVGLPLPGRTWTLNLAWRAGEGS